MHCKKIAEAEAAVSVNEKKWLVMLMHVQLQLDELIRMHAEPALQLCYRKNIRARIHLEHTAPCHGPCTKPADPHSVTPAANV
jgi:hypothetical protein